MSDSSSEKGQINDKIKIFHCFPLSQNGNKLISFSPNKANRYAIFNWLISSFKNKYHLQQSCDSSNDHLYMTHKIEQNYLRWGSGAVYI